MTGESDKNRMLDAVKGLNIPKFSDAKFKLQSEGKLNKGTQKALDFFYNRLVLKNKTTISRSAKGQIIIKSKEGRFRSSKGLERFIKKFKEQEKK